MAFRPTDPIEARQIAENTIRALADLRRCASLDQLMSQYRTWESYADCAAIVKPIRDHVRGVVNEVAITIKARRVIRDPTGEAA